MEFDNKGMAAAVTHADDPLLNLFVCSRAGGHQGPFVPFI